MAARPGGAMLTPAPAAPGETAPAADAGRARRPCRSTARPRTGRALSSPPPPFSVVLGPTTGHRYFPATGARGGADAVWPAVAEAGLVHPERRSPMTTKLRPEQGSFLA